MATLTLVVDAEFRNRLREFPWVNWSEIAREEARKKLIFEDFMRKRELSDEDWRFCERLDWHPVDELPLKKGFIEKMRRISREKSIKVSSLAELFDELHH